MGFINQDDRSCCSDESVGNDVFRNIPKHATAFCVWKIEGLGANPVPRNKIGTFQTNAAYIIYAVTPKGGSLPYPGMPTKDIKGPVLRAIHFWIGKSCDANVAGGAALRAAELDAQFSATILNRESESCESPRFLAYFRDKIIIEKSKNSQNTDSVLHKVTGVSIPILTELDSVAWENFSSLDVIILEIFSKGVVFLWIGSSSLPLHKKHAAKIAEIKKETNNNCRIVVVDDGYEQTMQKSDRSLFDSVLDPSSRIVIPSLGKSQTKTSVSPAIPSAIKLYKCTEQSGKYKVAELKSGPIFRSDLSNDSVFLIDRGEFGVWAWVGRDVNPREKLEAVRNARGFVKKKGYSASTPVARAIEDQEPLELKSLIKGWDSEIKKRPLILPAKFDPDYMTERPKMAADCQLVDDGSGERILWNFGKKEPAKIVDDCGIYYAESCYVMRYTYGSGRKSRVVVHYWKGAHSTSIDREAALDFACKLGEETNGQLVIASQGREPSHLLQIYKGKLTILSGQHKDKPPKKYLIRVLGSTPYTSKAVERPLRASSLDASGVFILFSSSPVVWCGGRSTGDSREASRRLTPNTTPLIAEGKEDEEFWSQLGAQMINASKNEAIAVSFFEQTVLGLDRGQDRKSNESNHTERIQFYLGRGSYSSETIVSTEESENRLYHCEVDEKSFTGKEILGFTQASLLPEAAWLLDTVNTIWIWLGNYSTLKTLKECIERAEIFLYTHPAGRDRNTTITAIRQGFEPPTFIGLFETWSHNFLRDYQSFNVLRNMLQNEEASQKNNGNLLNEEKASNFDNYPKYPLNLLKNEPENLPSGVNVERKELHLTYDDFTAVFKMKPSEFEKLPAWRRQRLKQTAGIF